MLERHFSVVSVSKSDLSIITRNTAAISPALALVPKRYSLSVKADPHIVIIYLLGLRRDLTCGSAMYSHLCISRRWHYRTAAGQTSSQSAGRVVQIKDVHRVSR